MPPHPSPSRPLHRSHFVSVALSLRGTRLARSAHAGLRAPADSGPSLGRTPRAAARAATSRLPFQLAVNPSLLALTAAAGCVI